jgi:hypothetical protein
MSAYACYTWDMALVQRKFRGNVMELPAHFSTGATSTNVTLGLTMWSKVLSDKDSLLYISTDFVLKVLY